MDRSCRAKGRARDDDWRNRKFLRKRTDRESIETWHALEDRNIDSTRENSIISKAYAPTDLVRVCQPRGIEVTIGSRITG
jgi:hypothetical protein